jgi:hypothetical protein
MDTGERDGAVMTMGGPGVVLWLFVLNLGVVFGAGVYEHRIVLPRWLTRAPDGEGRWNGEAARADDVGRRFWGVVSTLPLTALTLASLYLAAQPDGLAGWWWLTAALVSLVERLLTFAYFIPSMVRLMKAPAPVDAVARARRWSLLNYLRHVLVLAAWLAALRAFSLA